jgi:hypothetical protein
MRIRVIVETDDLAVPRVPIQVLSLGKGLVGIEAYAAHLALPGRAL